MDKENRTVEENALLQVLATLIERYEREKFIPEMAKPHEVLEFLMEQNSLRQRDLLDIFPSRSRVSEAISGKRPITHEQAALLAKRFGVPASLFLDV